MLSSHAYTFVPPEQWEQRRARTRANFERFNGRPAPPETRELHEEDPGQNTSRFDRIRTGLRQLRIALHDSRPSALIIIGDDQNENYTTANLPQFSMFLGSEFRTKDPSTGHATTHRADSGLTTTLLAEAVDSGFDVAFTDRFEDDTLRSHAHYEPLQFLPVDPALVVIPVFVNAIHVPAPTPSRCYAFGQQLRRSIDRMSPEHRIAIYASGGFSHFTAGYPWRHYSGKHTLGSICRDFDVEVVGHFLAGRGSELARLTSDDLLNNGAIELRQSIVLAGAIGDTKPDFVNYEPFFRAGMGMAVGLWRLDRPT